MARRNARSRTEITYADAADVLEEALGDGTRTRILDALERADFDDACERLRGAMRSHTFPTTAGALRLHGIVHSFDTRLRRMGLHVLESWDYVAQRFAPDITPVLMLERCALDAVPAEHRRNALSVLLDHYFMSVLGVIVARAWDEGDVNDNLDRAGRILDALQERDGSGRRFVSDVETLLLTSVSHYHPEEHAYETLVRSFDLLAEPHRSRMAYACNAVLASHLRWGMRFMYKRDIGTMRDDNVVDYPFVVYGLLMLLRDLEASLARGDSADERQGLIEGIVNGISADPWFPIAKNLPWLQSHREEQAEVRERLMACRETILQEMTIHQPVPRAFSPLGFDCNFLCNTVVAMVATGLSEPGPHPPLNLLFTRTAADGWTADAAEREAKSLMGYALGNAATAAAPLIVYDPREAAHAYNLTFGVLRDLQPAAVFA